MSLETSYNYFFGPLITLRSNNFIKKLNLRLYYIYSVMYGEINNNFNSWGGGVLLRITFKWSWSETGEILGLKW